MTYAPGHPDFDDYRRGYADRATGHEPDPPGGRPLGRRAYLRGYRQAHADGATGDDIRQGRLPGEAGAVRDRDIAHPAFDLPRADPHAFELTPDPVDLLAQPMLREIPEEPAS